MQIHVAARLGDLPGIQRQLARGFAIDVVDHEGCTPLVYATNGVADVTVVQFLLDHGAAPNPSFESSSLKASPLDAAAKRGDLAMVKALLRAGADASRVTDAGYNAILSLCYGGGGESPGALARLLVEHGANVNQVSTYDESPLSVAVRFCHVPLIRSLLELGADRSLVDLSTLAWAVILGSKEDVLAALQSKCDLEAKDRWNRTPWLLSLHANELDKARDLHEAGANVFARAEYDRSGLHFAALHGNVGMCRWLLSLGLSLTDVDVFEESPLVAAVQADSFDVLKLFLEAGAFPEAEELRTSAIVEAKSAEVVRLLVDAGWDINTISACGNSVLKTAVQDNQVDFVRELLAMGANPDATQTRSTALHSAMAHNHLDCAELLIKAGADVNAEDVDRDVPLFFARTLDGIELLLRYGAKVDNKSSWRPNLIVAHRDPEMVDRLIQASPNAIVTAQGLGELLLVAGESGDMELFEFLLTRNVAIDYQNSWGKSALMEAIENDRTDFVHCVCEMGANPNLVDEDRRTAIFYAAAPEAFTACQLSLENYPAFMKSVKETEQLNGGLLPLDIRERFRESPYGFVPTDNTTSLEILFRYGAEIEACDNLGRTALHLACQYGRPSKVAWLLSHGANREHRCNAGKSLVEVTEDHHDGQHANAIRQLLATDGGKLVTGES